MLLAVLEAAPHELIPPEYGTVKLHLANQTDFFLQVGAVTLVPGTNNIWDIRF